MDDLISRKALLAEYDRVHIGEPGNARKLIEDAPAVQQWISVKDRLPDLELVETKVTDKDFYPCLVTIKTKRAKGGRYVGKMWYDGEGFIDRDCIDWTNLITHWMPLPEPQKGE